MKHHSYALMYEIIFKVRMYCELILLLSLKDLIGKALLGQVDRILGSGSPNRSGGLGIRQ